MIRNPQDEWGFFICCKIFICMKIILSETQCKKLIKKLINENKNYPLLKMFLNDVDYQKLINNLSENGLKELERLFAKITSEKNMDDDGNIETVYGKDVSYITMDDVSDIIKDTIDNKPIWTKFGVKLNDGTLIYAHIDDIIKSGFAGESPHNTKEDEEIVDIEDLLKQMNFDNQKHQGVLDKMYKPHASDEKDVIGRNINEPSHKSETFIDMVNTKKFNTRR
jgi:hypothetical protein